MATTPFRFLQRRTSTSGRVPDIENLLNGELYIQLADETIYFRNDKGELVSVITDGDKFGLDKIKFTGANSGDFAIWNGSKFVPYSTGGLVGDLETGALASVFAAINHTHAQYVSTGSTGSFVTASQTGSFITTSMTGAFGGASGVDLTSYVTTGSTGSFVTTSQTGSFITTSMTGAFGGASGVDLTSYVTTGSTGSFVTTSQTGAFAPTGDYVVASATGSFVTTSQTGSFITTSMTGAFGGASGVDLTSYVTTGSTGSFVTTSQTGAFAPTGDYVVASATGSFVTTSQTGAFAPTGDYVVASATGSFVTTSQTGAFAPTGDYVVASATGSFVTTSQTGAFAPTGDYVVASATGSFVTTSQTGAFAPTGDYVVASATGSFVTASQTGSFASINGGYLLSSQIPTITGDICILAGTNNALICQLQGYPISITTPITGQTLQFNGTSWVPGDIPIGGNGGGGLTYYFNADVTPDDPITNLPTGKYPIKELGRVASTGQTIFTSDVLSQVSYTLIAEFVTDVLDPQINSIPAGLFDFNFWALSDATASDQTFLQFKIFKYDGSSSPVLISTSDDIYIYDPSIVNQYAASVVLPQTSVSLADRIYIQILGRANTNNKTISLRFGNNSPSHVHTTIPSVGGSGLVKVINGVMQNCASALVDSDVSASAAIAGSKIQSGFFALASATGNYVTATQTGTLTSVFAPTGNYVTATQTGALTNVFAPTGSYVTTAQTGDFNYIKCPSSPSAGCVLCYNGSNWIIGTAAAIGNAASIDICPSMPYSYQLASSGSAICGNFESSGAEYSVILGGESNSISGSGLFYQDCLNSFNTSGITSLAYGSGLYLAVSTGGKLATSVNGIDWTQQTSSFGTTGIRSVIYGSGLYIAAGDCGKLAISSNGSTWTQQTSSFLLTGISGLTYGNGCYIIAGANGKLATSPDGTGWTSRTGINFGTTGISTLAYGNGLFVAAGVGGKLATSTDATGWTHQTSSFGTTGINCIIYANSLFVAAGSCGKLATSTDGTGWTQRTSSFGTTGICTLGYGKGLYFAGGISGTLAYSFDACTWNQERDFTLEYGSGNAVCSIVFGDQLLIGGALTGRLACVSDANYTTNLIQNSENAKLVKTCNSTILNSKNSCLVCSCDSIILGGSGNNLSNVCNSIILGNNITGTCSNAVYVRDLCVSGQIFGTGLILGRSLNSNSFILGSANFHSISPASSYPGFNLYFGSGHRTSDDGFGIGSSNIAIGGSCINFPGRSNSNTALGSFCSTFLGDAYGTANNHIILNSCCVYVLGTNVNASNKSASINVWCGSLINVDNASLLNTVCSNIYYSYFSLILNSCKSNISTCQYTSRNTYINGFSGSICGDNICDVSILHGMANCITGQCLNNISLIGSGLAVTGSGLRNIHIIGSNITAQASDTVYVNNLCVVNGIISGNGAGITGIATGCFITTSQTGDFAPSGSYVTTSQTGTLASVFAPTGSYVTSTQTGTLASVFAPTGSYVTSTQTGTLASVFAPTGDYVTSTQTGTLASVFAPTGDYVTSTQTGTLASVFAPTGSYVTSTQTGTLASVFAPTGDYVTSTQTGAFSGNFVCNFNTGSDASNIITNSNLNCICATGVKVCSSVILGGRSNKIIATDNYCLRDSAIIGGFFNHISGSGCHAVVIGGSSNYSTGINSSIVGIYSSYDSKIGNGSYSASIIAGGNNFIACSLYTAILGGCNNCIFGTTQQCNNAIIGGCNNQICRVHASFGLCQSAIIGGNSNIIWSQCANAMAVALIGATTSRIDSSSASAIVGGFMNCQCCTWHSTILGGYSNIITNGGCNGAILGGALNIISGSNGNQNSAIIASCSGAIYSSDNSAIIGGFRNCTLANCSAIIGGSYSRITANGFGSVILASDNIIANRPFTTFVTDISSPGLADINSAWPNSYSSANTIYCCDSSINFCLDFFRGAGQPSNGTYKGGLNCKLYDSISAFGCASWTGNMVIRCSNALFASNFSAANFTGSTFVVKGAIHGTFISGATGCASRMYREFTEIYRLTGIGASPTFEAFYSREHVCNGVNYASDATNFGTGKAGFQLISGFPYLIATQRVGVGTGVNTCTQFVYDLCIYCNMISY